MSSLYLYTRRRDRHHTLYFHQPFPRPQHVVISSAIPTPGAGLTRRLTHIVGTADRSRGGRKRRAQGCGQGTSRQDLKQPVGPRCPADTGRSGFAERGLELSEHKRVEHDVGVQCMVDEGEGVADADGMLALHTPPPHQHYIPYLPIHLNPQLTSTPERRSLPYRRPTPRLRRHRPHQTNLPRPQRHHLRRQHLPFHLRAGRQLPLLSRPRRRARLPHRLFRRRRRARSARRGDHVHAH